MWRNSLDENLSNLKAFQKKLKENFGQKKSAQQQNCLKLISENAKSGIHPDK